MAKSLKSLARLVGVEPTTYGLEVRCSIQLSYRRPFSLCPISPKEMDVKAIHPQTLGRGERI
jgi:hypothetical protein